MLRVMERMSAMWFRLRGSALDMLEDCRGIAATEFAVIVPVMLVMFFGTVEISSGVAVDRKVTLVARTLSDLTSQSISVSDADLTGFFKASNAILTPYSWTPTKATITELHIDATSLAARVQWSKGTTPRSAGSIVTIPAQLAVADTYLIFSEVSYVYTPTIGYVMAKTGVNMADVAYTRPRQSACVIYPTPAAGTALPACPKL
jgi:Flp pilus assembly protein TadG